MGNSLFTSLEERFHEIIPVSYVDGKIVVIPDKGAIPLLYCLFSELSASIPSGLTHCTDYMHFVPDDTYRVLVGNNYTYRIEKYLAKEISNIILDIDIPESERRKIARMGEDHYTLLLARCLLPSLMFDCGVPILSVAAYKQEYIEKEKTVVMEFLSDEENYTIFSTGSAIRLKVEGCTENVRLLSSLRALNAHPNIVEIARRLGLKIPAPATLYENYVTPVEGRTIEYREIVLPQESHFTMAMSIHFGNNVYIFASLREYEKMKMDVYRGGFPLHGYSRGHRPAWHPEKDPLRVQYK